MSLREILEKKRQKEFEKDDLLSACTAAAIKGNVSFVDFKDWTEWLGVYEYVIPENRHLDFDLLSYITSGVAKMETADRARVVFKAWLLADMVESCLSPVRQVKTLRYLLRQRRVS